MPVVAATLRHPIPSQQNNYFLCILDSGIHFVHQSSSEPIEIRDENVERLYVLLMLLMTRTQCMRSPRSTTEATSAASKNYGPYIRSGLHLWKSGRARSIEIDVRVLLIGKLKPERLAGPTCAQQTHVHRCSYP